MKFSFITFIKTCTDINKYIGVSPFELNLYESGSYADFKVSAINDPTTLLRLMNGHSCRFIAGDGYVIVRVFEDIKE